MRERNRWILRSQVVIRRTFPGSQFGGDEAKFQDAVGGFKRAENDETRENALETLSEILSQIFAADLDGREQEISGILKRVNSLDKLIEQRREARGQVISLQVEVLENDAEGLGFFSTSSGGSGFSDRFRMSITGGAAPGMFGFGR